VARLLADAVHEEDVVVDPQRDQEDEAEDRQAGIEAGLVERRPEEDEQTPRMPKNDRITEVIRYAGRRSRASASTSTSGPAAGPWA
jgi:protein tyrosine phosphatase (PTP) superfamily phosphohydrolase (DUF442 family)